MTAKIDTKQHLFELLGDFSIAMLATSAPNGSLEARPMAIAKLEKDGHAYFSTDLRSGKVAEVKNRPGVLITFQSTTKFASLSGNAEIVNDRALIHKLWHEDWRIWFPEGKDDPNLVLLKVNPTAAEYWDNSGGRGIKYLFEGLKAYVQGTRPEADAGQNAKVRLG
jgi:general stress protein 26